MFESNKLENYKTKKGLFFLPLGGVGEIGANCYLYCCDNSWIMIDLGIGFADEKFPGVELLVPRLNFLDHIRDRLQAIIISHAHEDHAGAISYFVDKINCPVYATKFAYNLIKKRLEENNLVKNIELKEINTDDKLKLKNFILNFFETTHSIPEPYAIKMTTKYGNILHTSDWKIDKKPLIGNGFDLETFKTMGDEGILALIGDSTNAITKGYSGSEEDVKKHFVNLFSRYNNRIVITCFSSNIARLSSIIYAAKKNKRKVAIVGRSINRTIEAANECGYLTDIDNFVSPEELKYISKKNIVIICTGSQGEKRSALYRIAYNSHKNVNLEKNDVVIFSSRDIPGNEKSINNLKNLLVRQKVEIISCDEEFVHVSGHAYAEELKDMYNWTRPYISIPVHGEAMHLAEHAKIAQSCQVPITKIIENGSLLQIAPNDPNVIDKVETGKMIVEGRKIYNSESDFIRERLKFSYDGIVMVTILFNKDNSINKNILISNYGLPNHSQDLIENFKIEFVKKYNKIDNDNKETDEFIKDLSKKIVRKFCKDKFGRRPNVETHIIRI